MKRVLLLTFCFILISLVSKADLVWSEKINVAAKSFGNSSPRIAVNGKGTPCIIWSRGSDGALFFVQKVGNTFTVPIQLNSLTLKAANANWMGPQIASKGDTIYVVFKQSPEDRVNSNIYIVRSFDGGSSFSNPIKVDNIKDSISRFPTLTIDDKGHPIVAFMKFDSQFKDSRWVIAKSNDFGSTFNQDIKVSGWEGAEEVCDCCPGAVISNNEKVITLYRNNQNNLRDVWASFSTDYGNSFDIGKNIDNRNWNLNFCPASGPDAVIIDDTLYTVFMNGASGKNLSYLSKTNLSNYSIVENSILSPNNSSLSQQNYPRIANFNKSIAISWKQVSNSKIFIPLIYTPNIDNGISPKLDTIAIGNISNVDIALKKNNIFCVWEDDNLGNITFASATFDEVSSNKGENENQNEALYYLKSENQIRLYNVKSNSNISIYNIIGNEIYNSLLSSYKNEINIETDNWQKGIYIILLQNELNKKIYKININ